MRKIVFCLVHILTIYLNDGGITIRQNVDEMSVSEGWDLLVISKSLTYNRGYAMVSSL